MLVVHIEQAVRQWYETSYYYLRPRGTRPPLGLSGVTASHEFVLTTELAAGWHLFDQPAMIIDSGQYKLSSSYISQPGPILGGICLSRTCMENVWRLYYCHQRGGGRMFRHASQVNEIQSHFLDLYLMTPRNQNYQKCSHCSCEEPFSPGSRLVRTFQWPFWKGFSGCLLL